ncbi:hypothetical protein Cfor_03842 [Coptotermes formosanus]|uniref:Uncharacterized protein n=1 Tax=Coptotermes formosanus TaxID=36987 RepID=A0A6L2P9V4_COPFO|nr:hypothetical protein Cfor_03842 [Coptotermes formosanus]
MFAVPHGGVTETGSLQCIPRTAQLVVYRAQGAGNLSEFLQVVSSCSFLDYLMVLCQLVKLYRLKCGII